MSLGLPFGWVRYLVLGFGGLGVTRFGVAVCVWLDAWVVWFGGYCFHACLVGLRFDCLRTGVGTCYVGGFWCW